MSEVPDTWASIINLQYTKTLLDIQNLVKYHKESLEKLGYPPRKRYVQNSSNHKYSNSRYNFRKVQTNLVGWTNKLGPPPFYINDKNISPRKLQELGLVDIVAVENTGTMNVNLPGKEKNQLGQILHQAMLILKLRKNMIIYFMDWNPTPKI